MRSLRTASAEQTALLGERMASTLRGNETITLSATVGAGKTVLVKGIARGLGITEIITSPTFTIISEYAGRLRLIHVDLYRIGSEDEYDQLAVEEFMDSGTVVVIEWPIHAGAFLPKETLDITITIGPKGVRTVQAPDILTAPLMGETRD